MRPQDVYDQIYCWKDYRAEAAIIHNVVSRFKKSPSNALLDVACGTAAHAEYLKRHYAITGLDCDPRMLKQARAKFPGQRFVRADMRRFALGEKFDVITCLFSSIGYVKTEAALKATLKCMAKHLKPGGVLVIEPFFDAETFEPKKPYLTTFEAPGVRIARLNVTARKKNLAILDFHYLYGDRRGVRHLREKIELGLFAPKTIEALLLREGLKAKHIRRSLMQGRGLIVAQKPL